MKKFLAVLAFATASAFAASASHTHDGFFLSLSLGLGYQNIDVATDDYTEYSHNFTGLATDIDLKVGGRIVNNLILHLTLAGVTSTGDVSGDDEDYDDYKTNLSLLGAGVTYYFQGNFLATASCGVGQFKFGDNISTFEAMVDGNADTDGGSDDGVQSGFAFQLGFGKEWWVSDNWGIGATAAMMYGIAYNLEDTKNSNLSFTVRLTATWN